MNLEKLTSSLENYKKELKMLDFVYNRPIFIEKMIKLRQFLANIKDEKLINNFFQSIFFKENKEFFRTQNNYYMRAIETQEAIWILTSNNNLDNIWELLKVEQIKERYDNKAKTFLDIDFSKIKNFVMIWTWALPETVLYLSEKTDIENIICIDDNFEAVFLAWEMILKLGIKNVTLKHTNLLNFNFQNVDLIYIPWFTFKKNELIQRIINSWPKKVQIIINTPDKLESLLYDNVNISLFPELNFSEISKDNAKYRNDIFLLWKFK